MAGQTGQRSFSDDGGRAQTARDGHAEALWLLTLAAYPWGRFHARDLHKTNAAWASYHLLPPTAADGVLTAAAVGERWLEGNFQPPRRLRDQPVFPGIAALGGYPEWVLPSRTHYRAHIESLLFDYEASAFFSGQGVGKKIAGVQDALCDRLLFRVVSDDRSQLSRLYEAVRGRTVPCGKKSMLQFAWEAAGEIQALSRDESKGGISLAAVPVLEIGSMPVSVPSHLAVSSAYHLDKGKSMVAWQTLLCAWGPRQRLRAGVPAWRTEDGGEVSASLVTAVRLQ